ncbi:mitochondrial ribosomal protein subunit-domain-containing protein [Trametes maxima]|nr:mitochondrial ribosomal protein subunit-domain-containing protein [Trametes maxima]
MATPPPSQFAALLRRSKFASFDPNIGQVYTAFDGHAARGNFGLKRPLALRRRNAHITVQAIDSREQQTVWKSAEPQNRWIRMWDETGVTPTSISDRGAWAARLGALGEIQFSVDSELVPQAERKARGAKAERDEDEGSSVDEPQQPRMSQATRNLDAMSDKEFDWYLRRVRELRPAFREYLEKHGRKAASDEDKSLLGRSLHATGNEFKDFLAHKAFLDYHTPRPRNIEQQPHRYAGLSYTRSSPLQTQLNTKPHIGRVIGGQTSDKSVVVATAGVTSTLKLGERSTQTPPIDTFRFNEVELRTAPVTVGVNPQGLEGVRLTTDIRIDSEETRARKNNPYPPGSKEYVAYVGAVSRAVGMTTPVTGARVSLTTKGKDAKVSKMLLTSLVNIYKDTA